MEPGKSQIKILTEVLREFLRARGLGPRDIAKQLGVSERTVMRWFASKTIDSAVLERLCALVGLSFVRAMHIGGRRWPDMDSVI